jgi:NADH-quinone oxidoreductase subunit J
VGAIVAAALVVELVLVLGSGSFDADVMPRPEPHGADYSNTRELGGLIYTVYVYPFEVAALVLLVAIVAAIALTLRRRPDTKYQSPARQVAVRKEDRLRLIRMPAEKKSG